ncbi:hypothetical protein Q0F99_08610 [Rathayibacter oskolensis]|nr:hypothetical protein [Rathayibacter oskolensis]WKK72917.1 hypothetical protein Q0F99_08610 [Rathayibacter oskolensis]
MITRAVTNACSLRKRPSASRRMPDAKSSCGVRTTSAQTIVARASMSYSRPVAISRTRAPTARPSSWRTATASVPARSSNASSPPLEIGGNTRFGPVRRSGPVGLPATAIGIGWG